MISPRLFVPLCLAALAPAAAAAPADAPAPPPAERLATPPPSLSGVWVLDRKASDDPEKAFAALAAELPAPEARGAGRAAGPGGGGPGGMGGAGGMGGMGGGRPGGMGRGGMGRGGAMSGSDDVTNGDDERGAGMPGGRAARGPGRQAESMGAGWQRLMIAQGDGEVEVLDARERQRLYRPLPPGAQPPASDRPGGPGGPGAEQARWDGPRLVVEAKRGPGAALVTTYEKEPGTDRLVVTVTLQTARGVRGKTVRLVYDPA